MSNPPEFSPQPRAASASETEPSLPLYFLSAAILVYLGVLVCGAHRGYGHLHAVLLLLQYALILPAVLWCLLRHKDQRQPFAGVPSVTLFATVICFAALALPLSSFSARGLLNPDESAYSFQARIYRSGRIMADPLIGVSSNARETPAELLFTNHVLRPFGWFPKYPPGWPLVLSFGYLVSAPWLLAPLFGVMQLIVIAACGSQCWSGETGWLAALMAALSSFYLINSVGVMSHALCAILAATACLCLFRGFETGRLGYYAGMFACMASMLQVRPYTGFVLTLALTVAALWFNRSDRHTLVKILGIGSFFGALAIAGVLIYNHLYSGNWFVSPYAMFAGASLPPELSFNPVKIWHGIRQYGLQTAEESIIGAFPFVYLLAAYALLRETKRRREVWILAAVYISPVLAYLAHPADSGGLPFGERFHFEGFFALVLLGARGVQILVERWQTPRRALVWIMLVFVIMQITQQGATVDAIARRGEPYRSVREAIADSGFSGLVLLQDGPGFVAKHFNLNDADWHRASRIYLLDAEPERRAQWACWYGVPAYTVVTYDAQNRRAAFLDGKTNCAGATNQP